MSKSRSRGARLAVREARLITKELRLLGVPSRTIAKIWGIIIAVPLILITGYLVANYNSGTDDPIILKGVQITPINEYKSHVHNNTHITLKTITVMCSNGGDSQPVISTAHLGSLESSYGEDAYIGGGVCSVIRVNESHQLW